MIPIKLGLMLIIFLKSQKCWFVDFTVPYSNQIYPENIKWYQGGQTIPTIPITCGLKLIQAFFCPLKKKLSVKKTLMKSYQNHLKRGLADFTAPLDGPFSKLTKVNSGQPYYSNKTHKVGCKDNYVFQESLKMRFDGFYNAPWAIFFQNCQNWSRGDQRIPTIPNMWGLNAYNP